MRRFAFAYLLLLTACPPDPVPSDSPGDRGRVHLAYTSGRCGARTCPLARPIMVGAAEGALIVEESGIPPLYLRTTDPKIIEVTCKGSKNTDNGCAMGELAPGPSFDFELFGVAPGETTLELRTADGAIYDSLALRAAAADRVAIEIGEGGTGEPVTSYELKVGHTSFVSRRAFAGDRELQATNGISLCVTSTSVASITTGGFLSEETSSGCLSDTLEYGGLRGEGAGSTEIVATIGLGDVLGRATIEVTR